jgi:hypothetical protein
MLATELLTFGHPSEGRGPGPPPDEDGASLPPGGLGSGIFTFPLTWGGQGSFGGCSSGISKSPSIWGST